MEEFKPGCPTTIKNTEEFMKYRVIIEQDEDGVFESKLLPDGHLYCPKEYAKKKNARFRVIVYFEEESNVVDVVSEKEIEFAAAQDLSEDFLSEEELNYYLNLEEI